ncbi:hypothetical protein F4777DRAFT_159317 [Nemania sp. FL0916]|nr:hypothetical protein F4777DRAFT_159317 [Nemania sp. FL0916]
MAMGQVQKLAKVIKIPEIFGSQFKDWHNQAKLFTLIAAQSGREREVTFRSGQFSMKDTEYNVVAAFGQCIGDEATKPCDTCAKDRGRFTGGCIIMPAGLMIEDFNTPQSCFCCRYQWQHKKCSFVKNTSVPAQTPAAGQASSTSQISNETYYEPPTTRSRGRKTA